MGGVILTTYDTWRPILQGTSWHIQVWVTPQTEKKTPQKVGPFGAELATWLSATDHAGTFGAGFGGRGKE